MSEAISLFELAIEKEADGRLQDALGLYRQAYKLDDKVDISYREVEKEKREAERFEQEEEREEESNSDEFLLPPSPFLEFPQDIWIYIISILVIKHPESWINWSLTSRKNHSVSFDSRIWRLLCKLVYPAQILNEKRDPSELSLGGLSLVDSDKKKKLGALHQLHSLLPVYKTWKNLYATRPFIKFNGYYLSVINYYTEGVSNNLSWTTPVRTITYYRYIRFYPDGTLIKVLSALEPDKVVPFLLKSHSSIEDQKIFTGFWSINDELVEIVIPNGSVPYYTFYYHFQIKNLSTRKHAKLTWIDYYAIRKKMHPDDLREGQRDDFGLRNEKSFKFISDLNVVENEV